MVVVVKRKRSVDEMMDMTYLVTVFQAYRSPSYTEDKLFQLIKFVIFLIYSYIKYELHEL